MLVDSRNFASGTRLDTDLCIVGGGVAGLILADAMRGNGPRVCILESGRKDSDEQARALNQGENVGYPYYPLDLVRERRLGGSSLRWGIDLGGDRTGVRLRPLDPIDFETRPEVPHSGWPFPKAKLDAYYERAHPIFGLGPFDYSTEKWGRPGEREPFPLDADRVETTFFQFGPADSIHGTLLNRVEGDDSVTIVTGATAQEIVLERESAAVERLRFVDRAGREMDLRAKEFVLANGGIEAPRLLLLSNRQQPAGLGNAHDLVGRFFMEHPHFLSGMFVPRDRSLCERAGLYAYHSVAGTHLLGYPTLARDLIRREGLLNYCVSLWPRCTLNQDPRDEFLSSKAYDALRKLRTAIYIGERPTEVRRKLLHIAAESNEVLLHLFSKVAQPRRRSRQTLAFQLHHMTEQVPNPDSRITLAEETDRFGQRRPRLDWRLSELDLGTLFRAQEILDEAFREAGLGHLRIERFDQSPPRGITGGLHHMGTTRMHQNPGKGVVDEHCKVHGIGNLRIAGPSVFPSSGFANPTLTIGALALRLADRLKRKFK